MALNKLVGKIDKVNIQTVVIVDRSKRDPIYHKSVKRQKKFIADSRGFDLAEGDKVEIVECRPVSKKKRWKVSKVLK
ncbi:MAG: 30S ribosomal protein S17 [Candidatus Berkelbacteria bacterium]|nr:30S ribosomal protein S17 [Candidatus Berkelbacteria bacterium]